MIPREGIRRRRVHKNTHDRKDYKGYRQPRHQVGSCGSWALQKIVGPPRDQTDRDLPRTNGFALAYGAYATVYRSECPPLRESGLVTGPGTGKELRRGLQGKFTRAMVALRRDPKERYGVRFRERAIMR